MKRHFPILLLAGLLSLMAAPLFGQGLVKLTGITTPGSFITLTLQNTATIPPSGPFWSFTLQGSTNMAAGSWLPVTATFTPVSGQPGFFTTTIARPPGASRFFRVLGSVGILGTDDDGDGLPNAVEGPLGTGGTDYDSDDDGFSDWIEVMAGTDPANPGNFPGQYALPVASFKTEIFTDTNGNGFYDAGESFTDTNGNGVRDTGEPYVDANSNSTYDPPEPFIDANSDARYDAGSVSLATEGAGSRFVTVAFDRPFTGTLHYTVDADSTAVPGQDYSSLSGTVSVVGGIAQIVVTPIDDLVVHAEQRTVILSLTEAAGYGYRIGIRSLHTVRIADNDAYWSGTLKDKYAERNFRLLIRRNATVRQACFVAGSANDGLPILDTSAPGTSISVGIIPNGCFDAVVTSDTAALFDIISPELAAGTGGLFTGYVALARKFRLVSTSANSAHARDPAVMVGAYTETIGVSGVNPSYLDRTNTGKFVLVRDLPTRPLLAQP
jgi:hypothetical protein